MHAPSTCCPYRLGADIHRCGCCRAAQLTAQAQALAKSLSLQRNAAQEAHFKEAFLAAVEAEKERLLAGRRRPAGQPVQKGLPQAGAGQDAVSILSSNKMLLQLHCIGVVPQGMGQLRQSQGGNAECSALWTCIGKARTGEPPQVHYMRMFFAGSGRACGIDCS